MIEANGRTAFYAAMLAAGTILMVTHTDTIAAKVAIGITSVGAFIVALIMAPRLRAPSPEAVERVVHQRVVPAGILLVLFFQQAVELISTSIVTNAAVLTKVYVPAEIFCLSAGIASAINLAIGIIPLVVFQIALGVALVVGVASWALLMFGNTPSQPVLHQGTYFLPILGFCAAVAGARAHSPDLPIEIEAERLDQVDQALAAGADTILVDNMSTADIRAAVALVRGRAKIEISGGVTLERIPELAETGADFVSVGALTHSAPAVDISFEIEPI